VKWVRLKRNLPQPRGFNVVLNCIRNIFDELAFSSDAMFAIMLLEEKCKHFETAHVATREAAAMRYINDVRSLNKML
jgi:hypothetical protein